MRKTFRFVPLIALALIAITVMTTVVHALPAIGTTVQPHPYESNPTAATLLGDFISSPTAYVQSPTSPTALVTNPDRARDRNLGLYAAVKTYLDGYFELKTFTTSAEFTTISKVEFKLKYAYPTASADDRYRITYYVDPSATLTVLQDWSTAAVATTTLIWTDPTEPVNGAWDWTDISKIRFRIETDLVNTSDAKSLNAYEVYVRVYPAAGEGATPPTPATFPPTYAYDGDILVQAKFGGFSAAATSPYAWNNYQFNGYFGLSAFASTPAATFDIGWVDFKIRYIAPTPAATNPDEYRLTYNVLGTEQVMQDWTNTASSALSGGPYPTPVTIAQCWGMQPEPNDGTWTWEDIAALEVRFETRINGAEDVISYELFEVWLSIYPAPIPPSSTGLSVQPSVIQSFPLGETFFLDLYVTNVVNMWGYEIHLSYDTTVLTATEYYTYSPFGTYWPSEINDTAGTVSIAMSSYMGDPTGYTGSTPLCRIYFTLDADGSSTIDLGVEGTGTKLTKVGAIPIPHTSYDGWIGTGAPPIPEFPLGIGILMALAPIIPIVYIGRLRKNKPKTLTTQPNPKGLKP